MTAPWMDIAAELAAATGFARLREAVDAMRETYLAGKPTGTARVDVDRFVAAYVAVRFAATHAAAHAVLRSLNERIPEFTPGSLLDLGAGCGAASLAAQELWPGVSISAVEKLPGMVRPGKRILPDAIWRTASFSALESFSPHDAVLFSYSLGEDEVNWEKNLAKAWSAANQAVLVIEAGTPRGFQLIHQVREWLLQQGGVIAAPCPSGGKCPALGVDWCHFAKRLNRTSLHRQLKGGSLGYEDEKFSYVVGWKGELADGPPRILRHPVIEKGKVRLDLCQAPERNTLVLDRRDRGALKQARKLTWGDAYAIRTDPDGTDAELPD
jgi:ribosomal protein RSM22 (predicted rRNA methylase)